MDELRAAADASKAWPFEEARRLAERYRRRRRRRRATCCSRPATGRPGLPHIGTFGEVARTTMVRRAFETISDIPTRLICFSDDIDGMRKVPDNVPNQEMLRANLQQPLTSVPDPFGEHESFGRAQQRDAAAVPRHLRLRVRVRQRDRLLQLRAVRRGAAARGRALRRDHGGDAGDACARSGSRPIRSSCRSRRRRGGCSTCR